MKKKEIGKKRSDAMYNRMRKGKEDLEEYYKERERFCNETTCSGHETKDKEEIQAGLGMVCEFVGSSILPEDKRKYDVKWNTKFLEIGKYMEEKSQVLKKEREAKAQQEKEEENTEKHKQLKYSDIIDKAKLKCEIFKWRKFTRTATVFIQMMTLWIIAHLGVSLFMHIVYELKPDLIKIILLGGGLGIGMLIHWALNKKIETLMVKAYAKDKDWAERIRLELKD